MEQKPESIGLDTWGVDYALFDKQGSLLGVPYAYRDHRTDTAMEELFRSIPKKRVYELTGIQFMQFNTIFQLFAARRDKLPIMDLAADLLFVPDIINYFLTGVKKSEFTFATTSQLFNPVNNYWRRTCSDYKRNLGKRAFRCHWCFDRYHAGNRGPGYSNRKAHCRCGT